MCHQSQLNLAFLHCCAHTTQVLRKTGALPKDSLLHVKGLDQALSITDFAERAVRLLMCVVMVEEQADLTAFLVPLEAEQDLVRSLCYYEYCSLC
jgi:hypothetical protein